MQCNKMCGWNSPLEGCTHPNGTDGCEEFEKNRVSQPNFEALYAKALQEIDKTKIDNEHLRKKQEELVQHIAYFEGIRDTLQVVFGREFPRLFAPMCGGSI